MRNQFISNEADNDNPYDNFAANRESAEDLMPWACVVVEVEGGWMGFESSDDYLAWDNQQ